MQSASWTKKILSPFLRYLQCLLADSNNLSLLQSEMISAPNWHKVCHLTLVTLLHYKQVQFLWKLALLHIEKNVTMIILLALLFLIAHSLFVISRSFYDILTCLLWFLKCVVYAKYTVLCILCSWNFWTFFKNLDLKLLYSLRLTLNTDPTCHQCLWSYDHVALYKFDYYYYYDCCVQFLAPEQRRS